MLLAAGVLVEVVFCTNEMVLDLPMLTEAHPLMSCKAGLGCQIAAICIGIPFILWEAGVNLSKCQLDLAALAALLQPDTEQRFAPAAAAGV